MPTDLQEIDARIKREFERQGVKLPEGVSFNDFVADFWKTIPLEAREEAQWKARAITARENDNPDGFADFFFCCTRAELPRHALYGWIVPIYLSKNRITIEQFKAYYDRKEAVKFRFIRDEVMKQVGRMDMKLVIGIVIEASRELIKTTAITNYFTAYRIGQEPWRANLLIQVGDDIAKDNSSQVARIIREFQGWKEVFPHVIPDEAKGWGDKGYEVKQTGEWKDGKLVPLSDEAWNLKISKRKDPTLLGVGYSSHALIGKHPDGICAVDDILDENNTKSEKELNGVLDIVESVINYTFTAESWVIYVGTPWKEHDVIGYVKDTGVYISVVMPTFMEVVDGKYRYPTKWDPATEKIYVWEEERGETWVLKKLSQTRRASEFLRQVLLNLTKLGENVYRYQSFRASEIDYSWMAAVGADPVFSIDEKGGVSHYAQLEGLLSPYNKLIVCDGVLEKCGALKGEEYVVSAQGKYQNFFKAQVEGNAGGALFTANLTRHPGLIAHAVKTSEIGAGDKLARQFNFLEPCISSGAVVFSDADTYIMNMVRKYLDTFGYFDKKDPLADLGDALVMLVYAFPSIWTGTVTSIPTPTRAGRMKPRQRVDVGNYRYGASR